MGIMVGSGNSISAVRMAGAVVVVFIVVNQLVVIYYTVVPNHYTIGGKHCWL